jgi:Na+-transporting methylmalonyl-CoA/oxaloacetate decarboxylase gamma subunit
MKAIIGTSIGFIAAIAMFLVNETLAREVAVYVVGFGIAFGCIFAFILFAVALVPGCGAAISSVVTEIQAKTPTRKPAVKEKIEIKSPSHALWKAATHIDYDAFEMPTYLRRGFDREAL